MNTFFNKLGKMMRKGNFFLILVIILVLAIVLCSLYFALFSKKTAGTGIPDSSVETAEDGKTIFVEDIAEGKIEVPKFDILPNTYDKTKFVSADGLISYEGADSFMGLDVSEHQGTIDWKAAKDAGVDFVFVRSAFRGSTRGKIFDDKQFEANIAGASANGIKVGVYFFSQATTVQEAEDEASYVLSQVSQFKDIINYPVVYDWERADGDGSRTANTNGEEVTSFASAFCKKVSKAGYKTMVYMNKSMAYNLYDLDAIKDYDIWIAEYEKWPSFAYDFGVWQYTDSGTVAGVPENVDVNISFKDYSK